MTQPRLIAIAGLVALAMVGLPAFIHHAGPPPTDWRWVAAFAAFGASFLADSRWPRVGLLIVESAAAIALVLLRCNGYEGALLGVIAMQLGARTGRIAGLLWVGAQSLLLAIATSIQVGPKAALLLTPPYIAFQLVALFAFALMAREVAARAALASTNAELRSVQEILADSSRMAERLRIAHELHDALGHRLTTLTLNLEAALQLAQGAARAHVETAQSMARQLLADVREIVADFAARDGVELVQALKKVAAAMPRPQVHLHIGEDLRIADPQRAHVVLRCAQEIVTNAARHSSAENLWIVVRRENGAVHIVAHDDGRGGDAGDAGFGLRGMRERVARAGGTLRIDTGPGRGFGVSAWVPLQGGAP
jgi:signal transduction histidine kinase